MSYCFIEFNVYIGGKALAWFASLLVLGLHPYWMQPVYVAIRGLDSSHCSLLHDVPQSLVLGPLLYLLCTSPLGGIIFSETWNDVSLLR